MKFGDKVMIGDKMYQAWPCTNACEGCDLFEPEDGHCRKPLNCDAADCTRDIWCVFKEVVTNDKEILQQAKEDPAREDAPCLCERCLYDAVNFCKECGDEGYFIAKDHHNPFHLRKDEDGALVTASDGQQYAWHVREKATCEDCCFNNDGNKDDCSDLHNCGHGVYSVSVLQEDDKPSGLDITADEAAALSREAAMKLYPGLDDLARAIRTATSRGAWVASHAVNIANLSPEMITELLTIVDNALYAAGYTFKRNRIIDTYMYEVSWKDKYKKENQQ